jgi:hypothetical protein
MATTAAFKQQCPSCETLVAIRDPKFIGRKIDCPKCKYRFVVEPPAEADDEDDAKPGRKGKADARVTAKRPPNGKAATKPAVRRRGEEDEDEDDRGGTPAAKKKGGGSNSMVLGVGLAVVAVGLLVVGVLALTGVLGGDDKKTTSPPVTGVPAPDQPGEPEPKAPDRSLLAELNRLSNQLPNDSEAVFAVNLDKLMSSQLRRAAFDAAGALRPEYFTQMIGLSPESMAGLVRAENYTDQWAFNILRSKDRVRTEELVKALGGKPASSPVSRKEYFLASANEVFDALSTMLNVVKQGTSALAPGRGGLNPKGPLAFCVLEDGHTVVFADVAPLEKFLDNPPKPRPENLPKEPSAQPDPSAGTTEPPAGTGPGGAALVPLPGDPSAFGSGPVAPPGGKGGLGSTDGIPAPGPGSGSPTPAAAPPTPGNWLTLKPGLKRMLDELEDPREAAILIAAMEGKASRWLFQRTEETFGIDLNPAVLAQVDLAPVVGFAIQTLSLDRVACTLAADCGNQKMAHFVEETLRRQLETKILDWLKEMDVALPEPELNPLNPGGFPGGVPGGVPGGIPGGAPDTAVGGTGLGTAGGLRPPDIAGVPSPGGDPYQPGTPDGSQPAPRRPAGPVVFEVKDVLVLFRLNIPLEDRKKGPSKLKPEIEQWSHRVALYFKGLTEMSGAADRVDDTSRLHELAAALKAYVAEHGHFPPGALERKDPDNRRGGLAWRPNDRLSWMVEVVPYLPQFAAERKAQRDVGRIGNPSHVLLVNREESWNHPSNNRVLFTLIPQFVDARRGEGSWWVSYPGLRSQAAATHFVGVAGLGLDAAEYEADDPAVAQRLGVFGYDRQTRPEDIKDGPDRTIAVLQVPPEYKTPWLAGGGSTVRGVNDNEGIRPYVATQYRGQPGTFAIMADGTVRFLPATIADKDFLALLTISGGEDIRDLDDIAPEVKPSKGRTELRPSTGPAIQPDPPKLGGPEGGAALEMKAFSSKEGGFTVLLPGKPAPVQQTVKSPAGEMTVHAFVTLVDGGKGTFTVTYNDLPAAPGANEVEQILEFAGKMGAAQVPGAKLTDQKKIEVDGHPGRQYDMDLGAQGQMRMRVFIVKQRMYQTIAFGTKERLASKDAEKFFESFKLTDK